MTTAAEVGLQSLWSVLFDTAAEDIHANTSFHALAGASILALILVSMLRRKGHLVKVSDILSSATLSKQAALLAGASTHTTNRRRRCLYQ